MWPDRRWIKRFGRDTAPARQRLLCFHHAGGSASLYRHWPAALPDDVQVVAVQLPGRADRFREQPFAHMDDLIAELVPAVEPMLDLPFACYGFSMGARVAWALAHKLRERGMPQPRTLFVTSCAAPAIDDGMFDWQGHADGLEGYLRDIGGTPQEVLDDPVLLTALLPTLEADLTVLQSHAFRCAAPLAMPIRAFAGVADPSADPTRMLDWRLATTGSFDLQELDSAHFPDVAGERRILTSIRYELARTPTST